MDTEKKEAKEINKLSLLIMAVVILILIIAGAAYYIYQQKQQMSDLVDVDWNATISSYIMQQTALQASYKAFTDMQGLSLFQLNK